MAWSGSLSQSLSPPYVVGKFAREYSATGSKKFAVGKGGNYRPVTIQFTTLTGVTTAAPATVTVEQFESDIPGGAPAGTSLLGSRYWHVTLSGGTGQVYTITLDGTGTSPTSPVKILKGDGGTPVAYTASGTAPNYTVTGLTSFSDFALAQNANPTSLAVTSATGTYGGTTDLSATLTSSGSPLSGKTINFTLNGTAKGSATTDANGVATLNGVSLAGINAGTYSTGVGASFAADATYDASSGSNSLTVNKATATIVEVDNLSQIYDGTPKSLTAVTHPAGLDGISFTYNGSSTAPSNAGSYAIVASLNNVNYTASDFTSATLVIGKATATITPGNLTQTYDGSPKSATVTTSPAGLSGVSITYDGSATAPTNAGSYAVVASLNNANYTATDATGTLTINKATATITLSNLAQGYDGSPKQATATTSPAGLSGVLITYDGSATAPTNIGSYAVVASLNNANYTATNATGTLTINQGTATITLSNLTQTYDGSPKSVTVTTSPAGLSGVSITYDGSTTAPTSAGSYAVVASLNNANYAAADATGTLVINKATATLTLSNLTQTYNGSPKSVTVTTSPSGLSGVSVTYGGSATAPTYTGSYAVVASLSNANYTASDATGTLTINKATATITLSNLTQHYDGTPKYATATTNPAGLSVVSITYNGSPTAPTDIGSYSVVASLDNPYYSGNAIGTLNIQGDATITLSNLTQTYNGSPEPVTATTSPAGLSGVSITYNGSTTAPTNSGSYSVVASLNNALYTAPNATGTLTINKATATITLSNLTQRYDGSPNPVTATTNPAGLSGVSITYDGSTTAPSNAGSYAVVASLNNANYAAANVTGTLTINKATATLTLSNLTQHYDGLPKSATVTINPAGLSGVSITYNTSAIAPTNTGRSSV